MARQAAVGVYISSMWNIANAVGAEQRAQYGKPQAVVGLLSGIGRSDSQSLTQIRAREKEVEEEKKRRKDSKQLNKQQASAANTASVAQNAMSLVKGSGGIEKPKRIYKCRRCGLPKAGHTCLFGGGLVHERTNGKTPRAPDDGFGGSDSQTVNA